MTLRAFREIVEADSSQRAIEQILAMGLGVATYDEVSRFILDGTAPRLPYVTSTVDTGRAEREALPSELRNMQQVWNRGEHFVCAGTGLATHLVDYGRVIAVAPDWTRKLD